ncbi:MAG: 16S rRNA (uracil(1498)-N(3))-methyltransferase [Cardiobacteriaceae bacterium]|nr:16S rRNA (uracil(1498)-N(3))-methyltransferase [Cardiobacteriaceae bacterium]
MRFLRFFYPNPLKINEIAILADEVAHKVRKVLRLNVNQKITLVCGDGKDYLGEIIAIDKKEVQVEILEIIDNQDGIFQLDLYLAIIKIDNFELVLQKAVELGVKRIFPVISRHCDITFSHEQWNKKEKRFQEIIINAAMQCGRSSWCELLKPIKFAEINSDAEIKIIFSPYDDDKYNIEECKNNNITTAAILIGPEGGFSSEEVKFAREKNWQARQIGRRILRAETAAIAAMVLIQEKYANWQ